MFRKTYLFLIPNSLFLIPYTVFLIPFTFFLLPFTFIFAGAPANDDPCNAITLTVNSTCVFSSYSNANATASSGVPAPGCANYLGGDVWFKVTVPASGNLMFDSNTGVVTDGGMAIYSGACSSLSLISCDDDNSANGLMPYINATGLSPGSTIWIRFWEYGNDNNGTFSICVREPAGCATCTNAPTVASLPFSQSGTTCGYCDTYNSTMPCASSYMNGEDFLYKYTPGTNQTVNLTLSGTDTYTGIFVFDGCPSTMGTNCVASNTNSSGNPSISSVNLTAGTTYYIMISTWPSPNCTPFTISITTITCMTCASATVIASLPYTNSNTTCGNCNTYTSTDVCGSIYMNGEDYLYQYTPGTTQTMQIALSGTNTYTGIFVYDGCPSAMTTNCLAQSTNPSGNPTLGSFTFNAGTTYYILISTYPLPDCTPFTINISPPPPPTDQDCLGAIPVCQDFYDQPNSYSGTGNILNEINSSSSCLASGEKNDVWYVFTVQQSGDLAFIITPYTFADDYDWAVYNITNNNCSDIYGNSAIEVSCNYSADDGPTGPDGSTNFTSQGAAGNPFNDVITVTAGQTYVLNVSNFSSTQDGYQLDFNLSTATIFDIIPPQMTNIVGTPSCGTTQITVQFSEPILCSTLQLSDFTLTGPGGPYTMSSMFAAGCASGGEYEDDITFTISPAITTSGTFNINLVGTVTDFCANAAPPASLPFTITGVTVTITQTNVNCNGQCTGSATASASGGASPYTFAWSNGGTTTNKTNLCAGTYTVTATDAGGCMGIATITITQPAAITVTPTVTNTTCGNCNGAISVSVSGGTPAYTYSWSGGGTTSSITSKCSGTYSVTVTDSKGCTTTSASTIGASTPVTSTFTSSANQCLTGNSFNFTNTGTSGGGVTYSWTFPSGTPASSTTNNPTGVTWSAGGTYTITHTVTQAGCPSTTTQNITVYPQPSASTSVTNVSCGGLCTGAINLTASSGTAPYNYDWADVAGASNSEDRTNLCAGTYTVTVTDANGCTATATSAVTQPTSISNTNSVNNVNCAGQCTGSITATPSGGTSPYTYIWTTCASMCTNTIGSLCAGTYTVTVTD
ncbi:MAG: PKD domain-containing protein, partial [Bacteroidetes bacterium]|nr:PKD domain-containing protein [Bacteroidota bacterium]